MGGFGGKIGEWCDVDSNELFLLLLGVPTSVPILVKIDQEMRL